MKIFLKMFLAIIMAAFMLGAGYYLVLSNLSYLLGGSKPDIHCGWNGKTPGISIQTGNWVEKINFQPPLKVYLKDSRWVFQTKQGTLYVTVAPRLKLQWK